MWRYGRAADLAGEDCGAFWTRWVIRVGDWAFLATAAYERVEGGWLGALYNWLCSIVCYSWFIALSVVKRVTGLCDYCDCNILWEIFTSVYCVYSFICVILY